MVSFRFVSHMPLALKIALAIAFTTNVAVISAGIGATF
jgi:hypothetical protein